MEKTVSVWYQIRLETSINPDGNPDVSSSCLILRGNVINGICAIVSFLLECTHRTLTNPEPLARHAREVLSDFVSDYHALISLDPLTLEVFESCSEVFFPDQLQEEKAKSKATFLRYT
jgi:hypothetical protein